MALTVIGHKDGSFQWVEGTYTDAEVTACMAAADQVAWVKANATIVSPPANGTGSLSPPPPAT